MSILSKGTSIKIVGVLILTPVKEIKGETSLRNAKQANRSHHNLSAMGVLGSGTYLGIVKPKYLTLV